MKLKNNARIISNCDTRFGKENKIVKSEMFQSETHPSFVEVEIGIWHLTHSCMGCI